MSKIQLQNDGSGVFFGADGEEVRWDAKGEITKAEGLTVDANGRKMISKDAFDLVARANRDGVRVRGSAIVVPNVRRDGTLFDLQMTPNSLSKAVRWFEATVSVGGGFNV